MQQDHEEQAPEPVADDSGVESCTENEVDGTLSDDDDHNATEYAEYVEDTDDEDYDETFVFPLCHSYQLSNLLDIIQLWLAARPHDTRGLLVDCKVPERVTLVPMPREEDNYKYTGLNYCLHWPALQDCEIDNMNKILLNVV